MPPLLFWSLATVSVVAALFVVGKRSPLAGALALSVCLIALAGLFAGLSAPFLFIVQILVYAGAVIVLIIFVIMLLNLTSEELRAQAVQKGKFIVSALLCLIAAIVLLRSVGQASHGAAVAVPPEFGSIEQVGDVLLTRYLLAFEIASVILLVGIIGAVVIAKRGE